MCDCGVINSQYRVKQVREGSERGVWNAGVAACQPPDVYQEAGKPPSRLLQLLVGPRESQYRVGTSRAKYEVGTC